MKKIMPNLQQENIDAKTIVFINARIATMAQQIDTGQNDIGLIENGAILVENGKIHYCGSLADFKPRHHDYQKIDLENRLVLPALIDCHSHIIYGGNRAKEFALRLEGATYQEIANLGGGIASTVSATAPLSVEEMVATALPRLDHLLQEGVGVVEIKSGYGLSIDAEINMLKAAKQLAKLRPVTIRSTCLAAHALPAEYKGRSDAYIDEVVLPVIESAHQQGLIDAVDGFCEKIAFSPHQIRRVFEKAKQCGLAVKLHAEQLSNLGGAKLAAEFGALSADHLEYLDEEGVAAMAKSGTIAVLLPGAFYTLHEKQKPPIELFRKANVPMALATDCNPGTSPLTSILLTMNMAATLFNMRVEECLRAVTIEAARALGIEQHYGSLEIGKYANFAVFNCDDPAELVYRIGYNPLFASYTYCGDRA